MQVADLTTQLAGAKAARGDLQRQLEDLQRRNASTGPEALARELRDAREKLKESMGQGAELAAALGRAKSANEGLAAQNKALYGTLDETLAAAEHSAHSALQSDDRELQEELALREGALSAVQAEYAALKRRHEDALAAAEAARRDGALREGRLRREFEAAQAETAAVQQQLAKLQREHQHLHGRKAEKDKQLAATAKRADAAAEQLAAAERLAQEQAGLVRELESRSALLRNRNAVLDKAAATEKEARQAAEEQVRKLEEEISVLVAVVRQSDPNLEALSGRLQLHGGRTSGASAAALRSAAAASVAAAAAAAAGTPRTSVQGGGPADAEAAAGPTAAEREEAELQEFEAMEARAGAGGPLGSREVSEGLTAAAQPGPHHSLVTVTALAADVSPGSPGLAMHAPQPQHPQLRGTLASGAIASRARSPSPVPSSPAGVGYPAKHGMTGGVFLPCGSPTAQLQYSPMSSARARSPAGLLPPVPSLSPKLKTCARAQSAGAGVGSDSAGSRQRQRAASPGWANGAVMVDNMEPGGGIVGMRRRGSAAAWRNTSESGGGVRVRGSSSGGGGGGGGDGAHPREAPSPASTSEAASGGGAAAVSSSGGATLMNPAAMGGVFWGHKRRTNSGGGGAGGGSVSGARAARPDAGGILSKKDEVGGGSYAALSARRAMATSWLTTGSGVSGDSSGPRYSGGGGEPAAWRGTPEPMTAAAWAKASGPRRRAATPDAIRLSSTGRGCYKPHPSASSGAAGSNGGGSTSAASNELAAILKPSAALFAYAHEPGPSESPGLQREPTFDERARPGGAHGLTAGSSNRVNGTGDSSRDSGGAAGSGSDGADAPSAGGIKLARAYYEQQSPPRESPPSRADTGDRTGGGGGSAGRAGAGEMFRASYAFDTSPPGSKPPAALGGIKLAGGADGAAQGHIAAGAPDDGSGHGAPASLGGDAGMGASASISDMDAKSLSAALHGRYAEASGMYVGQRDDGYGHHASGRSRAAAGVASGGVNDEEEAEAAAGPSAAKAWEVSGQALGAGAVQRSRDDLWWPGQNGPRAPAVAVAGPGALQSPARSSRRPSVTEAAEAAAAAGAADDEEVEDAAEQDEEVEDAAEPDEEGAMWRLQYPPQRPSVQHPSIPTSLHPKQLQHHHNLLRQPSSQPPSATAAAEGSFFGDESIADAAGAPYSNTASPRLGVTLYDNHVYGDNSYSYGGAAAAAPGISNGGVGAGGAAVDPVPPEMHVAARWRRPPTEKR
eukprot:XP_001699512.1 predicted protein [Chlamydomonas reinhardtii]